MEYTKKHLRAAEETVYLYEKAIASDDPIGVFEDSRHFYGCRFCETSPNGCKYCLLYDGKDIWGQYPCARISNYNNVHFPDAVGSAGAYRNALKRRLKGLLRRMENNGYIFVEKE